MCFWAVRWYCRYPISYRNLETMMRKRCTRASFRVIVHYMNEVVLKRMAERLAKRPEVRNRRGESVEHPFGSIKQWMAQGAFLMRRLENVRGEFSLTAPAYNIRRAINIVRGATLIAAVRARSTRLGLNRAPSPD